MRRTQKQGLAVFSRRTAHDPTPNDLTRAVLARRAAGSPILDLTQSNPTQVGLPLLDPTLLVHTAARVYEPDALGLRRAKEAVAGEYAREGISVDPARIVITASTSEAYAYLFKIFADPGESIAIPAPSYPLFEFLARGESVETVTYPLLFDGHGYHYESALLRDPLRPLPRAVVAVAPNHPTGSLLTADFAAHVLGGSPLIVDEVFGRFSLDEPAPLSFRATPAEHGLTVRLSGLSKQLGLPQVKLSWMLVDGDPVLVQNALERIELVADTFLSVSGPVQHALPDLLQHGAAFRERVIERTRRNLRTLRAVSARAPLSILRAPAGWTAVVRTAAPDGDEALAIRLLEREGVLVHPGSLFGFGFSALVVSLLCEPDVFEDGATRLSAFATQSSDLLA